MMTMSKSLGIAQAKTYYQKEYANSRENYYTEGERISGVWVGQIAEDWNLRGAVKTEEYERLCDGQHPLTSEQLIKHVAAKTYDNRYGTQITSKEHRAAWDATFSAPKSVSLAALVGEDAHIRAAHQESVQLSLKEIEEYTQARTGGNRPATTTGRMIGVRFEHDSSRPDQTDGYAAPQLHTHVVIFNLTETAEGKIKSVQPLELYRCQQYATAIYRMHLAEKLQKLGYEIKVDRETGAPEIKGISRDYLKASSPRAREIEDVGRKLKKEMESEGFTVTDEAKLKQAAAVHDRQSKNYNRDEMRQRHFEMDARFDYQARKTVEQAVERGAILIADSDAQRRAEEAATFARRNAVEREAVADRRKVIVDALRRNIGLTTYDAVLTEINARHARGELVGINHRDEPRAATTRRMIEMERANIQTVLSGQRRQAAILEPENAANIIASIGERRGINLNRGQQLAVNQLLTTPDRIAGLQGGAGTGKTTALTVLREAAEASGYQVNGFAPTTKAARTLAASGIKTETLQRFIYQRDSPNGETTAKQLYILDESSLAGTKNLHKFFAKLKPCDRVLLVGDAKQHQAIEAGNPFEQLQRSGMKTVRLTEIVRQKDANLRCVVEHLSAQQIKCAVEQLGRHGRVFEVKDDKERLLSIARDFCAQPTGTLVISPANKERVALNAFIHHKLRATGEVQQKQFATTVLVNRQDMTGAERTFANSYTPHEDIVRYSRNSKVYGVKAGDYGSVIGGDYEKNTITVRLSDNREISYNPQRLSGVSVFKEATRDFAVGDRIQFRAPLPDYGVVNGELGTLKRIEDGKMFTIALDGNRQIRFDGTKFRHLDYGYAVTSHSSQGETVDRVIVNADTRESTALLNQRMAYVALSRARLDARIYTDSEEKLGDALSRTVDKQTALEALAGRKATNEMKQVIEETITEETITKGRKPVYRSTEKPYWQANTVNDHTPDKGNINWVRVTREHTCPVCHKPDNCAVSSDGELAFCRRIESERAGRDAYLHVLTQRADWARDIAANTTEVKQHERAEIAHRHQVYGVLTSALKLAERERHNLHERGLDEAYIEANGYKSVPSKVVANLIARRLEAMDLRGVPGFWQPAAEGNQKPYWKLNLNKWHQGLMIPVRDVDGRIEGFQIRRAEVKTFLNPDTGKRESEPRYVWLSSASAPDRPRPDGTSSGAPIHFRNVGDIRATGEVIITEGALKGDIIARYLNRGVIAVAGVSSFPADFGADLRKTLPELKKITIAFDADYIRNPNVQGAMLRLKETLEKAGLEVETVHWAESYGKGLDDYLLARLGKNFSKLAEPVRREQAGRAWHELVVSSREMKEDQASIFQHNDSGMQQPSTTDIKNNSTSIITPASQIEKLKPNDSGFAW